MYSYIFQILVKLTKSVKCMYLRKNLPSWCSHTAAFFCYLYRNEIETLPCGFGHDGRFYDIIFINQPAACHFESNQRAVFEYSDASA